MGNSYQTLFELTFEHDYFGPQMVSSFLKFGTRMLNASNSIKVKESQNRVIVYTSADNNYSNLSSICFSIDFVDPYFFNYTNLGYTHPELLYFSNGITLGNKMSSDDALMLPNYAKQFIAPFKSLQSASTGRKRKHQLDLPSVPLQNGFSINLAGEPAGAYQIDFEFLDPNLKKPWTFFSSNVFYQNPPQAIFEWRNKNHKKAVTKYTLTFKARATYWRYFMLGLSKDEWQNVQIKPTEIEGKTVHFLKRSKAQILSDGREAYILFSDQPIPLRERPDWKITLSSEQFPEDIVMPYAQPKMLQILKPSERIEIQDEMVERLQLDDVPESPMTAYCSDIFVNI